MRRSPPVAIGQLNGVAIALTYAVVNSVLALLLAFGITLTQDESAAVLAFTNNALVLIAYVAHVGAKHTKAVIPAPPLDESVGGDHG